MRRFLNVLMALMIVSGLVLGTAVPAGAATINPLASADSYLVGANAEYTLEFSLLNPYGTTPNDIISVIFPEGYDLSKIDTSGVTMQSRSNGGAWSNVNIVVNVTGQTIYLLKGTGSPVASGDDVRITIPGVTNPTRINGFGYSQFFSIQVQIQHGGTAPADSGTAGVYIAAGPMSGLTLAGPSSMPVGSRECFFVIGTDQYGNFAPADEETGITVYLSSSHTLTGAFYDSSAGDIPLTSVVISSGTHSASFYYQDTSPGLCTLTASDGEGGLEDASFSLDVLGNTAPVLEPIGNKTVNEGTLLTFTAVASDADNDTLTFSLFGGPPEASIDPVTGVFTWTPHEGQVGSFLLIITVTDDGPGCLSDSESILITVLETNTAPVLHGVPDSIIIPEMAPYTLSVTASDSDLPAQALNFSVSGTFSAAASPGESELVLLLIPEESQGPGTYTLTISVSDGQAVTSRTVIVTVLEVNMAPQLAFIGNQVVDEETELAFTASAVDMDIPANTLTFSLNGAPEGAAINPVTGAFTWTPTEAQGPGQYTFDIVVSDGLAEDSETITVTVNETNASPVAASDVAGTDEDTAVVIDVLANDSDPDGDTITVRSVVTHPAHGTAVVNPDNTITYTPEKDFNGQDSFVYENSDGSGRFNQALVTINVLPVNDAPVVDGIENQSIEQGESFTSFNLNDYAVDVDGDILTWSFSGAHDLIINIDPVTNVVTVRYPGGWYGTETITFTADDGSLTASDAAVFKVNTPPLPPILQSAIVSVSVSGEGQVTLSPQSSYYVGNTVNLTAVPAPGWFFAGWSGSLTGTDNPAKLYLDGNKNITATFAQSLYTLTLNTVGDGTVSASGSGFYRYGDKVILTAMPGEDYRFNSWTGDVSGTANPVEIIMDGDKAVTANFQWIKTEPPDDEQPSGGEPTPGGSTDIGNEIPGDAPPSGTPGLEPTLSADQTSDIQGEVQNPSYNWWWILGLVLTAAVLGVILSIMINKTRSGVD